MITGIDESQTLTKQYVNVNVILMVENVTRMKSEITINVGVSVKIRKKIMLVREGYIWNAATCSSGNGKYLRSITDVSVRALKLLKWQKPFQQDVLQQKLLQRKALLYFYISIFYLSFH